MPHPHTVKVTLQGPLERLDKQTKKHLRDRLKSAVSSRGFPRETQRKIIFQPEKGEYQVSVSVSGAWAEMANTQMADGLYSDVLNAARYFSGLEACSLEKQFVRH